MLILHTADLHLKDKEPARLKILEWIVARANDKQVDAVVIAGDLFDSEADANVLRPETKKIFERTKAEILVLPGNHDANSYNLNYDYGRNVRQLIQKPFTHFTIGKTVFVAIPFQHMKLSECLTALNTGADILIAHGTLYDLSIVRILREEDVQYMPIYPNDLENLCRVALLGHIHSSFLEMNYNKTKVLYPGAPVALSTKCRTPRRLFLIRMEGKRIETTTMDIEISPYYRDLDYFVFPGNEVIIANNINETLQNISSENVLPHIRVRGYIAENENEFKQKLMAIKQKYDSNFSNIIMEVDNIHSWDRLLKNPFVHRCVEKTVGLSDEVRMKVFELVFPHFSDIVK